MQNILHKSAQKIKPFQSHVLIGSTIALFCICSFCLGYLYRSYSQKAAYGNTVGLTIEYPPYVTDLTKNGPYKPKNAIVQGQLVALAQSSENSGEETVLASELTQTAGSFAASKSGTVYYPANCKALSRVHIENRVYFTSSAEAEELGYTLSKSCD